MATANSNRQLAQQQAKPQPRRDRSNSLQRMLELENQCVLERRHAVRAATSSTTRAQSSPNSPMQPMRPTIHTRHASSEQQREAPHGQSAPGHLRDSNGKSSPKMNPLVNGATPRPNPTSTTAGTGFKSDLLAPYTLRGTGEQQRQARVSDMSSHTNKLAAVPNPVGSHPPHISSTTFPGAAEDRNAVCQSPSWEAYGRRKKEKKKEKEQADKEAKSKKKRLSKLPPTHTTFSESSPSSPHPSSRDSRIQSKSETLEPTARPRPRQPSADTRPRPASTVALTTQEPSATDITPPKSRRGRSSSLSSIFRSPFETSRPSLDHKGSGFIGGIKLEHQRIVAYQRALNEESIGANGDIHPAFRKEKRRSPSPLRIFTPKHETKETQDRSYPPISIRTSAKGQGLIQPDPATMTEGRMSRWRAKVGLRSEPKSQPQKLTKHPSTERDNSLAAFTHKNASSPIVHQHHKHQQPPSDQMRYSPSMSQMTGSENSLPRGSQLAPPPQHHAKRASSPLARTVDNGISDQLYADDSRSDSDSPPSFTTAPPSPPTPPRKSSKRRSMASLTDLNLADSAASSIDHNSADSRQRPARRMPSGLANSNNGDTERYVGQSTESERSRSRSRPQKSDPPSIPYNATDIATQKRGLFDAARAVLGRGTLPPPSKSAYSQSRPSSQTRESPYFRGPAGENEIRSASFTNLRNLDALRFGKSSRNGTPNTSRPQSERIYSFENPADSRSFVERPESPGFTHRNTSSVDLNSVQSAAMKVMAAFPDMPPPTRPGKGRRTDSVSSLQSVLIPRIKQQNGPQKEVSKPAPIKTANLDPGREGQKSPPIRDLIMSKDESSAAAPWPATYLEAARKVAAPTQAPKAPTQAPPAPSQASPPRPTEAAPVPVPVSVPAPAEPAPVAIPINKPQSPPQSPSHSREPSDGVLINAPDSPPLSRPTSDVAPQLPPLSLGFGTDESTRFGGEATSSGNGKRTVRYKGLGSLGPESDPVAKMFVECCSCKYFHDLPSKLYEAMANPDGAISLGDHSDFVTKVSMKVRCPWCKHKMSTKCCAGYAAMVYVKERLH